MRALRVASAVALVVVLVSPVLAASDPGQWCAAAKRRAAGQKVRNRLQCYVHAILRGSGPDALCLARVEQRFATTWARIEALGGCATTGDEADIESRIDVFVSDLVAVLPSNASTTTSTTVTATSTCPPTTALYCGAGGCGFQGLCPAGMTCSDAASGCACVGNPIACGSLKGAFCRWGTCPAGTTCGPDPASVGCPPGCACH